MTRDRVIEVFYPSQAPHLAPIAAKMEAKLLRQFEFETASTPARLLKWGAAIAREREDSARFRRRIAIK
jgi:hypothetical protein